MFVMAAAAFGTFLTTFAVTINNHLPAAVCAAVAVYATVTNLVSTTIADYAASRSPDSSGRWPPSTNSPPPPCWPS